MSPHKILRVIFGFILMITGFGLFFDHSEQAKQLAFYVVLFVGFGFIFLGLTKEKRNARTNQKH